MAARSVTGRALTFPVSPSAHPRFQRRTLPTPISAYSRESISLRLSFVRQAKDVLRLRHLLEGVDATQPIIAKIEKPEGYLNLEAILEESDGVMVARGDLGVEMALEKVPAIQKHIIERARLKGKFVITATQMLESMVESPVPTRAEVSDVANAIYDGTSAVMLVGGNVSGQVPD